MEIRHFPATFLNFTFTKHLTKKQYDGHYLQLMLNYKYTNNKIR